MVIEWTCAPKVPTTRWGRLTASLYGHCFPHEHWGKMTFLVSTNKLFGASDWGGILLSVRDPCFLAGTSSVVPIRVMWGPQVGEGYCYTSVGRRVDGLVHVPSPLCCQRREGQAPCYSLSFPCWIPLCGRLVQHEVGVAPL